LKLVKYQLNLETLQSVLEQQYALTQAVKTSYVAAYASSFISTPPSETVALANSIKALNETSLWQQRLLEYVGEANAIDFTDVVNIMQIASEVAIVVTLITITVLWALMLLSYRHRVLELRKGEYFFDKHVHSMFYSCQFIGFQSGRTVLAFALLWFILSLSGFVFGLVIRFQSVRSFLWNKGLAFIVVLFSASFITIVVLKIVRIVLIVRGHSDVLHRRWYANIEVGLVLPYIALGILEAGVRTMLALVSLFLVYCRSDHPIQGTIEWFDPAFVAYIGVMLSDHEYNNPIKRTACNFLLETLGRSRQIAKASATDVLTVGTELSVLPTEDGKRRGSVLDNEATVRRKKVRNKLWLALTLHNNPDLQPLRGHALRWFRRAARTEDAQVASAAEPISDEEPV